MEQGPKRGVERGIHSPHSDGATDTCKLGLLYQDLIRGGHPSASGRIYQRSLKGRCRNNRNNCADDKKRRKTRNDAKKQRRLV
jgi:hypothetical protein